MLFQNDPFRELDALFNLPVSRSPVATAMPMDAYRRDADVWVHIDMPGVAMENVDIDIERHVLTVTAERIWKSEDDDQQYLSERAQGVFRRQVHLGEGLDAEAIEASLHDGVLTLRIPVAETAQTRKIEIKSRTPAIDVPAG